MPLTLWRSIFIEVGRLVLISTAVLVAVIAFAATVKPLADGKLTAVDAIRFMFYAVPPMLAYALPFAAGFGATLAYHRFAADNEAVAAFAGGVSHAKVLAPALALGGALTLGLVVLNDQIIPRFLTRMERLITKDLAQMMVRSLEQGESATLGNVEVHANAVGRARPEPGSLASDQILLRGLAGAIIGSDGDVSIEFSAPEAWVLIYDARRLPEAERGDARPEDTLIRLHAPNAQYLDRNDGSSGRFQRGTSPYIPLPSAFQDDPKFLTGGQLGDLRDDPDRMNWIDDKRLQLAGDLAAARVVEALRERVRSVGSLEFTAPPDRQVRLRAPGLSLTPSDAGWLLKAAGAEARVEVEVYKPDGTFDRYSARRVRLSRTKGDTGNLMDYLERPTQSSLTFDLGLEDVRILPSFSTAAETSNELPRLTLTGLVAANDPYPRLRRLSSAELIAEAGQSEREGVGATAERLERDIRKLGREITSKRHERVAMGVSCVVMVLTGAVMALRLRHAMPLVVYMWSFFPALGTIILISAGQQMTHRAGLIGLPVLWSGVVGLGAFAAVQYARLRRH